MHAPTTTHWSAVKRILRYLNGTLSHGLHFKPTSHLELHAYSDADWAGSVDDRRSTSGFCIFLGPPGVQKNSLQYLGLVLRQNTEAWH